MLFLKQGIWQEPRRLLCQSVQSMMIILKGAKWKRGYYLCSTAQQHGSLRKLLRLKCTMQVKESHEDRCHASLRPP